MLLLECVFLTKSTLLNKFTVNFQSLAVQRMDPHVRSMLRNYQLSDEVVERIANQNISFSQLASLCNEDLELLGITDEGIQNQMLRDFKVLDGQAPNFEE